MPKEVEEPEEIEEEVKEDLNRNICEFDLSKEGDDLSLFGDWEFVGFEHLETGSLFYFCLLRKMGSQYFLSGWI